MKFGLQKQFYSILKFGFVAFAEAVKNVIDFSAKEESMLLKISKDLLPKFKCFCLSPELIMMFVYMKCRFSLSYRDLEEMMQILEAVIDHSTLQRWVRSFARRLNEIARKHWGIENQLDWSLDVVFNEDKACIKNDNAAENMDILRKWVMAILVKSKPEQSIKCLMRKNAMSFSHLLASVNKIIHA